MTSQNDDPVAVVTGGNRGIGLELCRQLAASGHLVVLGGRDADMGAGTPGYHVGKVALNALNALTRTLAPELRDDRVLVNAVSPGWTATDMGGPGGRPIADGAAAVLWGATLPDDGPTGGFFQDGAHLPW